MSRKGKYKGDGLAFHKAVYNSGLTIDEVQNKLEVSRGTLYNYYEKEIISDEVKQEIAALFSVPVGSLFGENATEKPGLNETPKPKIDLGARMDDSGFLPLTKINSPTDKKQQSLHSGDKTPTYTEMELRLIKMLEDMQAIAKTATDTAYLMAQKAPNCSSFQMAS